MTRIEFRDYLNSNNCAIVPVDGINNSGRSVHVYNKDFLLNTLIIRMLPINDWEMTDIEIRDVCDLVAIPPPPDLDI